MKKYVVLGLLLLTVAAMASQPSEWAKGDVTEARIIGWYNGDPSGFNPQQIATKEQVISLIAKEDRSVDIIRLNTAMSANELALDKLRDEIAKLKVLEVKATKKSKAIEAVLLSQGKPIKTKSFYWAVNAIKYQYAIDEMSLEIGYDAKFLGLNVTPYAQYRSDNVLAHNVGLGIRSVNRF